MERFTFGVFLAFVAGCGGGHYVGGGGGPATLHDSAVQLATIFCQSAYQCCGAASAMKVTQSTDMNNCITLETAATEKGTTDAQQAIAAGTATFDAAWASCVTSAYRSVYGSCTAAFDISLLNACAGDIAVGSKPAGSQCAGAFECSAGSFCSSGICQLYAKAGEACTTIGTCVAGLLCSSGRCAPIHWLEDGQACGAPETPCKSNQCVSGTCARVPFMSICK